MKKSFNKYKSVYLIITLFLSFPLVLFAQDDYEKEYVTIIPNENYAASGLYELFFGAHWRNLWTTPVRVEVLDLDKFAGGLTPIKKGGGFQTKSLRFKGNDGKLWKFRSIDKDPSSIFPEELHETIVTEVFQDQISSSNPVAPLIVAPILDAVGILQAEPKMVYLPDSDKLGEFREEFGNLLGMIEIHPDEGTDEADSFEDAEKVIGTFKLLDRLEKKRSEKVDSKEYLKARLVDIFLGDWDRHTDQWRWARYTENGKEIWKPIPRDRDQAFSKLDGLFPWIGTILVPQFNHFSDNYASARSLAWSGRSIDRRFLTELDKSAWDSVTAYLTRTLTDDVIISGINNMPPEYIELSKDELFNTLKSRRDKLNITSDEYYLWINQVAEIHTSGKADFVEIMRNENTTDLKIYRRDKKDDGIKGEPFFSKTFDNSVTTEIRINLLDGDDKAILRNSVEEGPLIRVIGGRGEDVMIDSSNVNGYFLSITPIRDSENKTIFYDSGKKTKVVYGSGTEYDDEKVHEPVTDIERFDPGIRTRGHRWLFIPLLGYDPDNGLLFSIKPLLRKYNFRADPYEYIMTFGATYATATQSYELSYVGKFLSLIKHSIFTIEAKKTELLFTDYFGFGNETTFNTDLDNSDYYRMNQELIIVAPSLEFNFTNNLAMTVGISYSNYVSSLRNDTLLSGFVRQEYGLGTNKLFGFHSSLEFDSRDNKSNAYSGYYLNINGAVYPKLSDNYSRFYSASFDARTYLTAHSITDITLALRTGGEKVWGEFPFFKAAFLGGSEKLRGYSKNRFSGDASLFGQAELRAFVTEAKLVLRGKIGVFGFAETGRVFVEGESSDKWHSSYGGGIWISYLKRALNLSLSFAKSPERFTVGFQFGMAF